MYTEDEILIEVSRIFRGDVVPVRDGGVTDPVNTHAQIMEIAGTAFLMYPDSIFYLAQMVANRLLSLIRQEADIIEDMLVAVDDIPRPGQTVTGSSNLSNASSALLELDAASSVRNRPELDRFVKNIDRFTAGLRNNTVSGTSIVRTRDDARDVLLRNFSSLKEVHQLILDTTINLRDLIDNYASIDIPSRVSQTALTNVRRLLDQMREDIEESDAGSTIASSRQYLLRSLAGKAAVNLIATFAEPLEIKYRSPRRPIPVGTTHLGEVTGEGTPPFVMTTPGPWELPISEDIVMKTSETGASQTANLTEVLGATLNGRNSEDYEVTTERHNIHLIVDPEVREFSVVSGTTTTAVLSPFVDLGFKHEGSPISFAWPLISAANSYPRVITANEETSFASNTGWNAPTGVVTITGGTFPSNAAGQAFEDNLGAKFEILERLTPTTAVLDPREGSGPATGVGTVKIVGQTDNGQISVTFTPALSTPPPAGAKVTIGPAVKTGKITAGTRTAAQVVTDLQDENPANTSADPNHVGAPLGLHFKVRVSPADPTKVSFTARSRKDPLILVSGAFPKVDLSTPGTLQLLEDSANNILGLPLGLVDTDSLLTPSELVNVLARDIPDAVVDIVRADIYTGTLSTGFGTSTITDLSANFSLLEVAAGHQIEILSGAASGVYRVQSVLSSTELELRGTFSSSEEGLPYALFEERVQISSPDAGPGSYLEVVSAPSEILSVGAFRGTIPYFRAVSKIGEELVFSRARAGDYLKIVGGEELEITGVSSTVLTLASSLSSDLSGVGFEIRGGYARQFEEMHIGLLQFTSSPNLLLKNGYDQNLDAIDFALSSAITPGRAFTHNLGRVKSLLADLLSILTYVRVRADDYSAVVPQVGGNLRSTIENYSVDKVQALNSLINDLIERKYDRAVDLMKGGYITDFFEVTEKTASYGGNVLVAAQNASADLPSLMSSEYAAALDTQLPVSYTEGPDPDENFSDTYLEEDYEL